MLSMTREEIHAELRRRVARVHKEYFGKGPSDIAIIYFGDVIIIKIKDFLSPFEKEVLKLDNGFAEVARLRDEILDKSGFKGEINDVIDNKISFIKPIIDYGSEEYYLFIKCTCAS